MAEVDTKKLREGAVVLLKVPVSCVRGDGTQVRVKVGETYAWVDSTNVLDVRTQPLRAGDKVRWYPKPDSYFTGRLVGKIDGQSDWAVARPDGTIEIIPATDLKHENPREPADG